MSNSNVAIVTRMYELFNAEDMDTIRREIFAANLVWRLPGRHPLGGTKNGPDEVIAFFLQLNKANIKVDLINIDSWGENTVVEVHRGHGEYKGKVLDALNCTHYHIHDGKIEDVQVYISDQYGADDFFSAVFALKTIPERLA